MDPEISVDPVDLGLHELAKLARSKLWPGNRDLSLQVDAYLVDTGESLGIRRINWETTYKSTCEQLCFQ